MKKLFIIQPAGLGDIFFLQKLCKQFKEDGYDVYHKVDKNMWDAGANRLLTTVNYHWDLPEPSLYDYKYEGSRYPKNPADVMRAKYKDTGLDYSDWKDFFHYRRNHDEEDDLRQHFGIEKDEPFVLWNNKFAFDRINDNVEQNITSNLRRIQIDPGLTNIFNWCWLLENAAEIHTVDTSLCYIIETLNLSENAVLKLHPRFEYSKQVYDGILQKPWEWVL